MNKIVTLDTPVHAISHAGPRRIAALEKLNIQTAQDLLEHYPRDWVFTPEPMEIGSVRSGMTACIIGIVERTEFIRFRRPHRFIAHVADPTGKCQVIWFNGKYMVDRLGAGDCLVAWGKFGKYKGKLQLSNPKHLIPQSEQDAQPDKLGGAVYPATADLSSGQIRYMIRSNLKKLCAAVEDHLPETLRKENDLPDLAQAYYRIHLPDDEDQAREAKRRLKYDELFLMQLGLALRRFRHAHTAPAPVMENTETIDSRIRKRFPFLLTEDQDSAIEEIAADMGRSRPMNRLLQGDVGSGKTVVALYAALLAVANRQQVSIMAPTEILATQHYNNLLRYLAGSKVRVALLTGGMKKSERTELLEQCKTGEIDILLGTIALIEQDVQFASLGLVVIDEQHKFGVHQRAKLRKETAPHCLVMTATPIPRTLAMTAFGDLDVSVIKHSPPGRGKVITRVAGKRQLPEAYEFIRKRLAAGKQAYFVYPRIDSEDETSDIRDATGQFEILRKKVFPRFNVALLHGQLKNEEKNEIMHQFRTGKVHVLVSTVVIEVGMDVPNATIMVIENADRFGLAQLHQLRGRIGRGQSQSYCFLIADTDTPIALERLEVMAKTTDGFKIAEKDLEIRGPGELFSTRQHGLPDLKIADIIHDADMLRKARKDAFELIEHDPSLNRREHQVLRKVLIRKFGDTIGLVDIA